MQAQATRHFQPTQLRGVNRDQRTVDIVASDFSIDSYGTRIDPAGWDLERFKANPVICLQHDSYSGLPVAAAVSESVRVENAKLVMTIQFPPEGTSQDSDEAFGLIAAGVLRGVSVGFDPTEYEDVDETVDGYKKTVRIYRKQRLMEVSFVTIPSNDNGLVVRARELNADPDQLKKQTEQLESHLKERMVTVSKEEFEKFQGYFERKKPANKAATAVLKKFFEDRGEEQPDDEVEAWKRMGELMEEEATEDQDEIDTVLEKPEEVVEEKQPEPQPEVIQAPKEEEPTTEHVESPAADPQPERAAPVQIPLKVLAEFPSNLTRSYVDAAVAALRQGIPVKDACTLIDGMNAAATSNFPIKHGSNS